MEVRGEKARRKDRTSKHKAKAKNGSVQTERDTPSSQQASSRVGVRTVLSRVVTWLKQSAVFSWLHHAAMTLKQSIMGNQSWPVVLVQIGLWLLLLWLLSNLHMGLPCFLIALVFWLYSMSGGGPPLSTPINWRQEERRH